MSTVYFWYFCNFLSNLPVFVRADLGVDFFHYVVFYCYFAGIGDGGVTGGGGG